MILNTDNNSNSVSQYNEAGGLHTTTVSLLQHRESLRCEASITLLLHERLGSAEKRLRTICDQAGVAWLTSARKWVHAEKTLKLSELVKQTR